MKKLVMSMVSGLFLFSVIGHAAELCASLPGVWEGAGLVRFDLDTAKNIFCVYRGTSRVTSQDPSSATFISDVSLSLLSGPCPQAVIWSVPGVCNEGNIIMESSDGNTQLTGKLLNSYTGTLSGTAKFEIDGMVIEGKLDKTLLFKIN